MRLLILYLILILVLFGCKGHQTTVKPGQKPIKTLFLKKKMSLRNGLIRFKYMLNKKPGNKEPFKKDSGQWVLTFSDEFDSLDLKKWRPNQPWGEVHPANPHQYYDAEEVKVKNGYLYLGGTYKPKKIKVKDSIIEVPYAIGLVNSDISFKQKYGYFEIRSRNPSGAATWPAFWLTGATRWPPEIDIFEMYGRKSGKSIHNQYYSIHWGKTESRSRGYLTGKINLPNNTDSVFHVYGCEWTPYFIKFFTDGKLTGSIRVNNRLRQWLDDEMVIIINNCFDAKYLKYLPKDFKSNVFIVDWIRVWKKSEN